MNKLFSSVVVLTKYEKDVVNWLDKIGYKSSNSSNDTDHFSYIIKGFPSNNHYKLIDDVEKDKISNIVHPLETYNQECFRELCLMREDTDKNQLFVLDVNCGDLDDNIFPKGSFVRSFYEKWPKSMGEFDSRCWPSHRATPEEIIEFYNNL